MRRLLHALGSAGLLGLALWLLDLRQIAAVVGRFDPTSFALAVVAILGIFVLLGVRWYWIAAPVVAMPTISHLRHFLYATFANTFTPATLGSDVYRVAVVGRIAGVRLPVLMAVIYERYIGLVVYLALYLLCLPAAWAGTRATFSFWANPFIIAGVACSAALVLLLGALRSGTIYVVATRPLARWSRVARLMGELRQAAGVFSRRDLVRIAGISVVTTAMWILVVDCVAVRLGVHLPWTAIGAITILTELIRLVPVTLQGVGLRESSFAYFVGLFGGSPEAGFVLGALVYLALSCAVLLSGPLAWLLSLLPAGSQPAPEDGRRQGGRRPG
jgi:uncharacterized protein (TIRG00374 family)